MVLENQSRGRAGDDDAGRKSRITREKILPETWSEKERERERQCYPLNSAQRHWRRIQQLVYEEERGRKRRRKRKGGGEEGGEEGGRRRRKRKGGGEEGGRREEEGGGGHREAVNNKTVFIDINIQIQRCHISRHRNNKNIIQLNFIKKVISKKYFPIKWKPSPRVTQWKSLIINQILCPQYNNI